MLAFATELKKGASFRVWAAPLRRLEVFAFVPMMLPVMIITGDFFKIISEDEG